MNAAYTAAESPAAIGNAVRQAGPLLISRVAPDFGLLDVWELPVEGDRGDFDRFLDVMMSFDPAAAGSATTRFLFWARFRLGALLGWDDPAKQRAIPGATEMTLADRVPPELRGSAPQHAMHHGFVPLYRTSNEFAAELSNETVHGVLHVTWVEERTRRYRARLAVYVKPRGVLGRIYLSAIRPLRHLIVYPTLMREIGSAWNRAQRSVAHGG